MSLETTKSSITAWFSGTACGSCRGGVFFEAAGCVPGCCSVVCCGVCVEVWSCAWSLPDDTLSSCLVACGKAGADLGVAGVVCGAASEGG
eukprot:3110467-Amphidinium_carterae.1